MVGDLVGAVCPLSRGDIQTWTEVVTGKPSGWGVQGRWGEEDRRERVKGLPTFFLFENLLSFPH